ncbi:MAG: flagellar hook protein FlgE [Wolinella sp.]
MLRSMWSGVSGMQVHQVGLDVEGHNISNVNTMGFKYSRANFADMLSQINHIATPPYGGLGGQNDYSVGLGATVNSTTKIFSQGSMTETGSITDLGIGGDGFFVVSGDGGRTHAYTRNGAFTFDAKGNLVNNEGQIVQGWVKDLASNCDSCCSDEALRNVVDTTRPIRGINIDPRLTIPAKATSNVTLDAKLTSGDKTKNLDCAHALDSTSATASDGLVPRYDSSGRRIEKAEDIGALFNGAGDAMRLREGQGVWVSYKQSVVKKNVANTNAVSEITLNGTKITFRNDSATTGISTLVAAQNAINAKRGETGIEAFAEAGALRLVNDNSMDGNAKKKNIMITGTGTGAFANFSQADNNITAYKYSYTRASKADSASGLFRTTEDLRALMQQDANRVKHGGIVKDSAATVKVTMSKGGMFEIQNQEDGNATKDNLGITVSSYYDRDVTSNVIFKTVMQGLNTGVLAEGGSPTASGPFMAGKLATTIDIVDSLGNKHTLTITFRKTGPREWSFSLHVPEPGTFVNGSAERPNYLEGGRVTFGETGALTGMTPSTIQFNPNNGSKQLQRINLNFGESGTFKGLTSTDEESATDKIDQNGYQSGTLQDKRFNTDGVLIGKFSNGKSLALAQVALASFTNNSGLQAQGSNLYTQTGNSGEPTIGTPNTGGRGQIIPERLEASNVDLSRALTNLIIIQRGFQANSKTVTTSDQILNTLINLKQ